MLKCGISLADKNLTLGYIAVFTSQRYMVEDELDEDCKSLNSISFW